MKVCCYRGTAEPLPSPPSYHVLLYLLLAPISMLMRTRGSFLDSFFPSLAEMLFIVLVRSENTTDPGALG
jgi:hypothetical protein